MNVCAPLYIWNGNPVKSFFQATVSLPAFIILHFFALSVFRNNVLECCKFYNKSSVVYLARCSIRQWHLTWALLPTVSVRFIKWSFGLWRLTRTSKDCGLNFGTGHSIWGFAILSQPLWLHRLKKHRKSKKQSSDRPKLFRKRWVRRMYAMLEVITRQLSCLFLHWAQKYMIIMYVKHLKYYKGT